MVKVALDSAVLSLLNGGTAKLTLTNADGKTIGHYLPDDLYQRILDALVPGGDDDRAVAVAEYDRCEVVTTSELLASLSETGRRWDGRP